ncbi:MAG TPA: TIM44-like domain-containing protein [Ramlibacter sp.]|uniref:Tim44 domain-containing protein n=1 Tax=Ramlibacter sp. TaxID=1917967 RepID=UPI002ED57B07
MKKAVALMAIVLTLGSTLALDAEAKRLGGGKSSGMQRQNVTAPASPTATPGSPATTAPAAGSTAAAAAPGAAAAAPKRSWMGPVAGIAAGLGIAALASHFGFGEALANMLTIALVAFAVLAVIGFFLRKRAQSQGQGPALAGAGAGAGAPAAFRTNEVPQPQQGGSLIGSRLGGGTAPVASTGTIPAGFDVAAFERNARDQFMGLQSANDAADLQRLRDYVTPELFELAREEVQERGGATQQTEVFGLNAQVLDVAEEADRYVVSVRFTGSVRDQHGAVPEDLDETWHLVKPRTGFGGWLVAGIQQNGA